MDADKFKSVAINIKTYRLLEELAQKKFELPISMSKTVEFYIQKGHEEFKTNANTVEKDQTAIPSVFLPNICGTSLPEAEKQTHDAYQGTIRFDN